MPAADLARFVIDVGQRSMLAKEANCSEVLIEEAGPEEKNQPRDRDGVRIDAFPENETLKFIRLATKAITESAAEGRFHAGRNFGTGSRMHKLPERACADAASSSAANGGRQVVSGVFRRRTGGEISRLPVNVVDAPFELQRNQSRLTSAATV